MLEREDSSVANVHCSDSLYAINYVLTFLFNKCEKTARPIFMNFGTQQMGPWWRWKNACYNNKYNFIITNVFI